MSNKSGPHEMAEKYVRNIRRKTRWKFSSEEKLRVVLEGQLGEYSIAELCGREGISPSLYHNTNLSYGH